MKIGKKIVLTLGTIVLAGGVSMLGGCGAATPGESTTSIRLNPTPVEQTLYETQDDIDNRIYGITFDQNLLMMNEDLGRALLLDRPSRLTPEPVAY